MTKWQRCAPGAGAGTRVEWLEKAFKNRGDEANYIIALENPKAADDFSDAIFASVDKLAQSPPWAETVGSNTPGNGQYPIGLT